MRWWLDKINVEAVIADERWTVMRRQSGLPDDCRSSIDGLICWYRMHRAQEIKEEPVPYSGVLLKQAAKQVRRTMQTLRDLQSSADAYDSVIYVEPIDDDVARGGDRIQAS